MSLGGDGDCFSVEYPNQKQYAADPTEASPKEYLGLDVINVTERFSYIFYIGFFLELAILIFVLLGIFLGRFNLCSDLLGLLSLVWFIWLLFYRYDHYGKVCAGDYLTEPSEVTQFHNLQTAGLYV